MSGEYTTEIKLLNPDLLECKFRLPGFSASDQRGIVRVGHNASPFHFPTDDTLFLLPGARIIASFRAKKDAGIQFPRTHLRIEDNGLVNPDETPIPLEFQHSTVVYLIELIERTQRFTRPEHFLPNGVLNSDNPGITLLGFDQQHKINIPYITVSRI